MWKSLTGFSRKNKRAVSDPRQNAKTAGITVVTAETTREVLTPERLNQALCGEVLGVRSFIKDVNGLETRTMQRVDRISGRGSELAELVPRVPAVIPKLLHSLRDEDISGKQLASEISHDPALLADVVRLASSPFYRTREPIRSVEHATLMLGRDALRKLVLKAAFRPLLDTRNDYFSQLAGPTLWKHAEKCSASCDCLAKQENAPAFEAYLAGLTHKIGFTVVTRVLSQEHDGSDVPRSFAFRDWVIARVPSLSLRIARQWGLPSAVTGALGEITNSSDQGSFSTVASVLYTASKLTDLHVLSAAGRIRGDVKRISCRINGTMTDGCRRCYSELSRLDEDFQPE